MAADKDKMLLPGQFLGDPLVIGLPLRAHQDNPGLHWSSYSKFLHCLCILANRTTRFLHTPQNMLYRRKNRIRLQHHASASAIRRIVDSVMLVA
ncbi:hypothetical protein D3C73_1258650 [compost metagenome]